MDAVTLLLCVQTQELLKETRMKKQREEKLRDVVEKLKDVLLNMTPSPSKEHKVHTCTSNVTPHQFLSSIKSPGCSKKHKGKQYPICSMEPFVCISVYVFNVLVCIWMSECLLKK